MHGMDNMSSVIGSLLCIGRSCKDNNMPNEDEVPYKDNNMPNEDEVLNRIQRFNELYYVFYDNDTTNIPTNNSA